MISPSLTIQTPTHSIPVHVVDDDIQVLNSRGFLLSSIDIEATLWHSASDFLAGVDTAEPAVVISDIMMPGLDGKQLQQRLLQQQSPIAMIALTGRGEVSDAVTMLKLGAVDYLEKPISLSRLQTAIDSAFQVTQQNLEQLTANRLYLTLTDKEQQVAQKIVDGKINKVIADEMHISNRTVEVHRSHIMEKMQAEHLSELIQKLLRI